MRFLLYGRDADGAVRRLPTPGRLAGRIAAGDCPAFAVISREDADLCLPGAETLLKEMDGSVNRFVALIRRRPPPVVRPRTDGPVESFACAGPFGRALAAEGEASRLVSAFDVLEAALAAAPACRVRALQAPGDLRPGILAPPEVEGPLPLQWMMPHRGSLDYLRQSLGSIATAVEGLPAEVSIGIDDPEVEGHASLAARIGKGAMFFSAPSHSGPYLIRNALLRESSAEIVFFQDSDDFSCEDRGRALLGALARSDSGMIGSHELRLDCFQRQILPVRYPLDVSAALARAPGYVMLHPASAARRRALAEAGGFSTLATYAMDYQFLLRSHFLFRSENLDRFLYVRRLRAGSLTTHRQTDCDTLVRRRFRRRWERDFFRVREGALRLEASALALRHGEGGSFALRSFRAGTPHARNHERGTA